MKNYQNKQKSSYIFRIAIFLLAVYSVLLYYTLVEHAEQKAALLVTGDCYNWYGVVNAALDEDGGNDNSESIYQDAIQITKILERNSTVDQIGTISRGEYNCQEENQVGLEVYNYNSALMSLLTLSLSQGRLPEDNTEVVLTKSAKNTFTLGQSMTIEGGGESHTVTVVGFFENELLFHAQTIVNIDHSSRYTSLVSSRYEHNFQYTKFGAVTISEEPWREMGTCPIQLVHCMNKDGFLNLGIELEQERIPYFDVETAKEIFSAQTRHLVTNKGLWLEGILFLCCGTLLISEWTVRNISCREFWSKGIWILVASLASVIYEYVLLFAGGTTNYAFQVLWVVVIVMSNLGMYALLYIILLNKKRP